VLVGFGVDLIPNLDTWIPSIIVWSVAFIWAVITTVYWLKTRKGKQTEGSLKIEEESTNKNLVEILANMHRRVVCLQTVRLRQRFNRTKFNEGTPLIFDKLGLVQISDWPDFEKKIKKRLKSRIPKSTRKRKDGNWRYKVLGEAAQIKQELAHSKEWQIEDAVKIGEWLDDLHMGLKELRDHDQKWQNMYEMAKQFYGDLVLKELIIKHESYSYAFCSVSLSIGYSAKLGNKGFFQIAHAVMVGSNISPNKIEDALSEITEQINSHCTCCEH